MQIVLSFFVVLTVVLSMLQCEKSANSTKGSANNANIRVVDINAIPLSTPGKVVEEAPRISLADAKADFDKGAAIFVDTRAEVTYKDEHIKGSINLPAEAFEARYKELPTDKKIIAYCS